VMSISFAALIAAQVSFMRMFGVGLTLASAGRRNADPNGSGACFMHVMGGWNWWAPRPLVPTATADRDQRVRQEADATEPKSDRAMVSVVDTG